MSVALANRLPVVPQARAATLPVLGSWPGLLSHAAIVAIVAASLLFQNPAVTLVLGGITVFPLYLWLCWREGRRAPLCVSPLSFMFLWNSIGLGLSAIYMAFRAVNGEYLSFSTMQLSPADLAHAYSIYLAGMVAMHAGMELLRPATGLVPYGEDLSFERPLRTIFAGLGIGLVYLFRQNWFSFLGGAAAPLSRVAIASVCMLALLPHWYLALRKHVHWILLASATALLLTADMKTGSKASIMFSFFPLVWAMIARKELRRNLIYASIALTLLYTGVVAPTISETRTREGAAAKGDYEVLWNAAQDASPVFSGEWSLNSYIDQFEGYLYRMFDPTPTAFLIQEVDRKGFRYGETMKYATYAFIPRILWPQKPNVSRGGWFTAYLGAAPSAAESTTSTGISAVGELYWNFGVPGVIAGMLGIGILFGRLWRMSGYNPIKSPLRLLLYVYITLGMPDLAEAVSVVVSSVSLLIIFGSIFFLLKNRSAYLGPQHASTQVHV